MNFFKKLWAGTCSTTKAIWQKINKPHGVWLALFYVFFVAVLAVTLTLVCIGFSTQWYCYILYVISALSLTYFVYTIVIFAPSMKTKFINFLKKHKFTNTLLENYGYRTIVFSVFSFILNVAYISFVGVMAILSKTAWYFTITVYYIVLAMMKGNVFYSKRKYNTDLKEARAYRFSGIMFIILTLAFSGCIILIYKANHYFEYAGLLIYAAAAFTFYKLSLSIYNIFKARKHDDLYVQNIRNINLASALISIIILQVAMFQAFSPESNMGFANALTGGGISAIILALGIYMIVKANKKIKELNKTNETQE